MQSTDVETYTEVEAAPSMDYFPGRMPAVRLAASYQFALCVIAAAMVLLPLIYLGFIALIGWGMWAWAIHAGNYFFPESHGSRRIFGVLVLVYITPLLVGLILALFMLKCFFSRWRVVEFSNPLSSLEHPEVFRFLGQLCQQMNAPIPSRVDVSMAVNASAGFREGFRSLFGNDIMLTFGLPLVAGLNCREFAALVAHEFGHFTQKSAMRFDFIIQTIHGWLYRAVYDRDELDDWLEEEEESAFALIIFIFARLAIGFTRAIMWCLLVAGHSIASFMSRQMEFHADACAIAVAGTDAFVSLLNKLQILSLSAEQAAILLSNKVQPKWPDDLSSYIAMLASQCAGETQGKVLTAAALKKTRWSYSHPSHSQRVQRALLANQPGIIQYDQPAATLFAGFSNLSRTLTLASYELARRGKPISADELFHVEASSAEQAPDTSTEEPQIKQYFCGLGLFLQPIFIGSEGRPTLSVSSAKVEQLVQARATLQGADLLKFREALKQLDALTLQLIEWDVCLRAGFEPTQEHFPLAEAYANDIPAAIESVELRRKELILEIAPFEEAAKLRLRTALGLLRTPALANSIQGSQMLHEEAHDLLHGFGKLSAIFPGLLELRKQFASFEILIPKRAQGQSELLESTLSQCRARSEELLKNVHNTLGSAAYPFAHPRGHITIVDYARAKQYDPDPVRMAHIEIRSHLQMLFALYHRILGRLVAIALQVEAVVDNQPLRTRDPNELSRS